MKRDAKIDLDDIQAHLISSARPAAARYYFFRISDPKSFTVFLGSKPFQNLLLSEQDVLEPQQDPMDTLGCFANIAFSFQGLVHLGLPRTVLGQFPLAFREGMAGRAAFIGDNGVDAPEQWCGFYGTRHIHGMLALNYMPWYRAEYDYRFANFKPPAHWSKKDQKAHFRILDACWQSLGNVSGIEILQQEEAHVIRYESRLKEHFGFDDGISQPKIAHARQSYRAVGKKRSDKADWEPLATGEFVLGYLDELDTNNRKLSGEDVENPRLPMPKAPLERAYHQLTMNGSFLAYRKLEQDVKGFRAFCDDNGGNDLAEKLVGRTLAGAPLGTQRGTLENNEFDFGDDPEGKQCPFASHVRRVNPRLTLNRGVNEGTIRVDQHRIVRRGMAYGPFIQPGIDVARASKAERGLHFFCYNARLDSQFEFIQKNWINSCDFMRFPSSVVDPIVGNRSMDGVQLFSLNESSMPVSGLKQFVFVRGGEYFFTPGKQGLALIAGLSEPLDPFVSPKQHIKPFEPESSDPFDIAQYVDAQLLMSGKCFVKLWVDMEQGKQAPFYYFAKEDDLKAILGLPHQFTNDLYRKRVLHLTDMDMLLSAPESPAREADKRAMWSLLKPEDLPSLLQGALAPELGAARERMLKDGSLDLVSELARRLPLAMMKHFFGVQPPAEKKGKPLSKAQIADFFDRDSFELLPPQWQENYTELGFSTTPDDTLLFWTRALFLEVFLNQYNASFITNGARQVARELIPHLEKQIRKAFDAGPNQPERKPYTVLTGLIELKRPLWEKNRDARARKQIVAEVRQHLLEFMVGSTDTTAKAITQVISTLLGFGKDLISGIRYMLRESEQGNALLDVWLQKQRAGTLTDKIVGSFEKELLNPLIINCLRLNPVAPMVPRYCTNGATYTTSTGEVLNIEPGATVCLVAEVTMKAKLKSAAENKTLPPAGEDLIFFDHTPHGCMGRELAMYQIREALKMLLSLDKVRPAAGKSGMLQEKFHLPVSLMLRVGSD